MMRFALILFVWSWVVLGLGCTYRTRPVQMTVTDYATAEPVDHIAVKVKYVGMLVPLPEPVEGTTDVNGQVILTLAEFTDGLTFVCLGDIIPWGCIRWQVVRSGGWAEEQHRPTHKYKVRLDPIAQ